MKFLNRRSFIEKSGAVLSGSLLVPRFISTSSTRETPQKKVQILAHLWVYASKFPPHWDATPILETIFSDLSYAQIEGLELMEPVLRHEDSEKKLKELIKKFNLPVSGSSYGVGLNMWNQSQHQSILNDIQLIVPKLGNIGGKTFGISVGNKKDGLKTESELDAQAELLKEIRRICTDHGIEANLHNHTYEVENNMHDLKGTLARIPDFKLGPDLNWLIRAGINPVDFINIYGEQIVYLHIRDQYKNGTWSEYVGQGDTDFKPIADALNEKGFSGSAAIELAFPKDYNPEYELKESWKMSREFVQKTFNW